jgi:uncharacterized MnhB-related membrane protein
MENTIEAHSLGQLIDHSFRMAIRNYKKFALPVLVYSAITTLLLQYMFTSNAEFFSLAGAGASSLPEDILASFHPGSYFLIIIAVLLISPLFQYIVCDLGIASFFLREEEWKLSESLNKGISRYIPFLLVTIISSLMITAGIFIFIVGALIAGLYLSLIYPVMVFEEGTPKETLRRSFLLIRGNFWKVALAWILFWLIFAGIDLISSRLLDLIHNLIVREQTGFVSSAVYFVLNAPIVIFTIAFQSCFSVNLYFNQRIKKEGFGIE